MLVTPNVLLGVGLLFISPLITLWVYLVVEQLLERWLSTQPPRPTAPARRLPQPLRQAR